MQLTVTTRTIDKVTAYLSKLKDGREYTVTITPKRVRRSIDQNSLYWLWIACLSDETGNDRDDLHEFFKRKFLGVEAHDIFGEVVKRSRSTTTCSTAEFTIYLNKVQAFAASEAGVILPLPEDKYFEDFMNSYAEAH